MGGGGGWGGVYSNRYCCSYTRFQQSSIVYSCNVFKSVVRLLLSSRWTFEVFHHCRQRCTAETANVTSAFLQVTTICYSIFWPANADLFPVVASRHPKSNVCLPKPPNEFWDVRHYQPTKWREFSQDSCAVDMFTSRNNLTARIQKLIRQNCGTDWWNNHQAGL